MQELVSKVFGERLEQRRKQTTYKVKGLITYQARKTCGRQEVRYKLMHS
jgi:hypothetical protein